MEKDMGGADESMAWELAPLAKQKATVLSQQAQQILGSCFHNIFLF